MKVYVDELPKKCADCPLSETGYVYDDEVRFCKLQPTKVMNWIALYNDKRDDCPLQSLTDYTKQVRKEVCEEIKKFLNRQDEIVKTIYYNSYQTSGLKVIEETIELLDQIGETK